MEDPIHNLPTNNIPPTEEEKEILKWLFPKDDDSPPQIKETTATTTPSSFQFIRSILILGVVFFIFQIPIWKSLLSRFFPILHNDLLFAFIKTLFFIIFIAVLSFFIQARKR